VAAREPETLYLRHLTSPQTGKTARENQLGIDPEL
jgi:hypothetical protein